MKPKRAVGVILIFLLHLPATCYAQQTNDNRTISQHIRAKAEMGDEVAQVQLGNMLATGNGVEKDFVEAYAWLNLAAKFDEKSGKQRDSLELRMTPQQIADAQKRTKELRLVIETKKQPGSGLAKTNAIDAVDSSHSSVSASSETNKRSAQIKAVQPNGAIRETYIGGSIFKEERKRPLPNAFGKPDIFGRKIYAGYTELHYKGLNSEGLIILQITEVDTQSTETTMSRSGQSHVQANVDKRGAIRGSITHPPQGSTQVLPPNTTQFTFDPTKETELVIAGYRVRFLEFTPQKLKYSYAK